VDDRHGGVSVAVDGDRNSSLLDRESNAVVDVMVMATDSRNHSSAALLSVRLADRNDNRPMFSSLPPHQTGYVGVINENSPTFTVPVTVTVRRHCTNCAKKMAHFLYA